MIFIEFWEDDGEIRIGGLGAKGVDGVDVPLIHRAGYRPLRKNATWLLFTFLNSFLKSRFWKCFYLNIREGIEVL